MELVPSSKNEIEEKIATLEALYDITRSRKQQAIVESLLGFWFPSGSRWLDPRATNLSVADPGDIEFFMQGEKLLIRYASYNENFSKRRTSIVEPIFEGDNLIIEVTYTFIWNDSPPYTKDYYRFSYVIDLNAPAIDKLQEKSLGGRRIDKKKQCETLS